MKEARNAEVQRCPPPEIETRSPKPACGRQRPPGVTGQGPGGRFHSSIRKGFLTGEARGSVNCGSLGTYMRL